MLKEIKIGGINYNVQIVERLQDNDEAVWGCTDYKMATIFIDEGLSSQKQNQVLIHETLHASLHEAGLDDICNDEKIVNPLGNILYQLIEENDFKGGDN
ncbi:hypothetical protein CPEBRM1_ABPJDJAI_01093 [Companilactobacillus paralimentarius]|uniref:ImmA/IrrE family metallo-endopeptidase n=1 Tax=Companilactobacillus paralimentarius TaxID=83526 RepID=UPI00384C8115